MGQLEDVARALVAPGKGILAADESSPTIEKRFKNIDVASTEENRRDYREMLFRTEGAEEFVSGVILFDETLRQEGADGTRLAKVLEDKGIIPGIKIDKGAKQLAGARHVLVCVRHGDGAHVAELTREVQEHPLSLQH